MQRLRWIYNNSKAASTTNDELMLDRDPAAAAKWDEQFERMWNEWKNLQGLINLEVR